MKRKVFSLLIFSCSFLFVRAQPGARLMILPERPVAQQTLTLCYYPAGKTTPAAVNAVVYVYDTLYRWHVYDLPMTRSGDTAWKAPFCLSPEAGFVAYKFRVGSVTDNNQDKGYFTMISSPKGGLQAGAEAGYGLLRTPSYELGVPGYFKDFSISDTATYLWLSNEIMRHRSAGAPEKLVLPYVKAILQYKKANGLKEVNRAVNYLLSLKDTSEDPLLKAYLVCANYVKDTLRSDSLHQVILRRFPAGGLARQEAYYKAVKAKTAEERFTLFKNFISNFPYSDAQQAVDRQLGINYYQAYRNVTAIAIAQQHPEIILDYQYTLPFENLPEVYYKSVEIPYDDWKTMNAQTAITFSEVIYQRMLYFYTHQPAGFWYYSPVEWKEYCDHVFATYFRLHARILMELTRDKEALALAKRAQQNYQYQSSDLNQTEAMLLEKAGEMKALDTLLRAAVHVNQVTAPMIAQLHKLYTKTHQGNGAGFDAWMESLKDAYTLELLREEIHQKRLALKAADFSLQDNHGNTVSLSSLKGKVVVMDFWATWCAPCKAAMAGMNLAVQKYRNDPDVVFLFIDTQERIPDYKDKADAFLKEKGYPFTVLSDTGENREQTYQAYSSAIHTSGIPFKVILDKQGMLRYANVGYMGSPSGLSDEISMMIESARREK